MKGLTKATPAKEEPQSYIDCTGNLQVWLSFCDLHLRHFEMSAALGMQIYFEYQVFEQTNSGFNSQVWRVNGKGKTLLPTPDLSKFYSGDCYIFQYSYPGEDKEEHLVGTWFGKKSIEVSLEGNFYDFLLASVSRKSSRFHSRWHIKIFQ